MDEFYRDTLNSLIQYDVIDARARTLVVCGGVSDREVLMDCGFNSVVISNLDDRFPTTEFSPYGWSYQDAEALSFDDDEFDFCIAHSGLHHCRSPHRGLLEMYRVAKYGVLVFEPIDNVTTRMGVRLGLGEEYEIGSVAGHGCQLGGLRNTSIPNYIYRWTEREIEKVINSYAPLGRHDFHYFYKTRINWARARVTKNPGLRLAYHILGPVAMLASRLYPRESNNFAFCVMKPDLNLGLHPWLRNVEGRVEINREWMNERYRCESMDSPIAEE